MTKEKIEQIIEVVRERESKSLEKIDFDFDTKNNIKIYTNKMGYKVKLFIEKNCLNNLSFLCTKDKYA